MNFCMRCSLRASASALDDHGRCDECRIAQNLEPRGVKHGPGGRGGGGPCDPWCAKCKKKNESIKFKAGIETIPCPPFYDGLTAEECLQCYTAWLRGAANEGLGHKLSEWMSTLQLNAARDLWSAQLHAKVVESSKPKLTIMMAIDPDDL